MSTQPSFRFTPTIQDQFEQFHKDNPRIYELLVRFAFEAKRVGCSHYSIDALFHVVRWHIQIETKDMADFKLNNNYTSRYARLIMGNYPELAGFFEVRGLKAS